PPLNMSGNSWWIIEGINFKRSVSDVLRVFNGSSQNVFRRIVAWDGNLTTNNHVVSTAFNSNYNLFEDLGAFGPGRFVWAVYQSHDMTCRRCWLRWEGSTTAGADGGPKMALSQDYGGPGDGVFNNMCENCLTTWNAVSMPNTFTYTGGGGQTNGSSDPSV